MKSPREALQPESVPPPPSAPRRRRASLVSIVSGVLSFIIVATVVIAIGWSFAARKVAAPGPLDADKTVNIPKGDDVAETLAGQGVIDSAQLMKATLLLEGNKANVKAGEYLFKQGASLQDVIDTLVSGHQVLHALTIPEGLTSLQTVDRLRDDDVLVGDIKTIPPEGSLMPDTYKFARGTTRDQLVRTMQQEARRVVAEVWSHREQDTPIRSSGEMVTLASIVEKETGKAEERPRVAGVFMNRLAKSIPLQSDPTIVYGIVGGKGTLGRGIMKSEVEQKTPYNTYTIVGLPPGPIANPGRAAMEAVANPSRTKELYFVADGTGGHAFAETLDQHRANVIHWRQIEKDAKDKLLPDADKPGQMLPGASPGLPKTNQRGDAEFPPSYGVLGTFGSGRGDQDPKPWQTASTEFPLTLPADASLPFAPPGYDNGEFNGLDVEVEGASSEEAAASASTSDEPTVGEGPVASFPLSVSRQAELTARAVEYGLPTSADKPVPVQTAMEAGAPGPVAGRPRIFDASEGTPLDPLRDNTYDLNSAKSVPVLKPLPPMATLEAH